jgi:hypothetical protein
MRTKLVPESNSYRSQARVRAKLVPEGDDSVGETILVVEPVW